jgi:chitosanase
MSNGRSLAIFFVCLCWIVSGCGGSSGNDTPSANDISPDDHEKAVMLSLVAIAENSQTTPVFDYAENINDGRGITFGIIGFTTGTFDGNEWLHHYTSVNPTNRLAKYSPAMDAIDAGPHPDGMSDDVTGLDGFIADFRASLNDAYFKQSQIDVMDEMYWTPSLTMARSLGIQHNIMLAQIFDASIQMGEDGMADIVDQTSLALGGAPRDGVDEIRWLTGFLDAREDVLSQDPVWNESIDRIDMFRHLLQTGNYSLETPFDVTCYGDSFTATGVGVLP